MGNLFKIALYSDFSMYPLWVYEWALPQEHYFDKASFPVTIVWVVLGGQKEVEIGDVRYNVKRGDVVIIPPLVPRRSDPPGSRKQPYSIQPDQEPFYYITCGASIQIGSLDFVRIYQLPAVVHVDDPEAWASLEGHTKQLLADSDRLLTQLNLNTAFELSTTEKTYHLDSKQTVATLSVLGTFHEWFRQLLYAIHPSMPEEPLQIDPRILEVCEFVRQNLPAKLTASILAEKIHLSDSHLRLLFRRTFNISPMGYVRRVRMQQARELLLNSDYRIQDVGKLVGYDDMSLFSRCFLKSEGISPSAYRSLHSQGRG
jgi:AraC-like DNA-binding protein